MGMTPLQTKAECLFLTCPMDLEICRPSGTFTKNGQNWENQTEVFRFESAGFLEPRLSWGGLAGVRFAPSRASEIRSAASKELMEFGASCDLRDSRTGTWGSNSLRPGRWANWTGQDLLVREVGNVKFAPYKPSNLWFLLKGTPGFIPFFHSLLIAPGRPKTRSQSWSRGFMTCFSQTKEADLEKSRADGITVGRWIFFTARNTKPQSLSGWFTIWPTS